MGDEEQPLGVPPVETFVETEVRAYYERRERSGLPGPPRSRWWWRPTLVARTLDPALGEAVARGQLKHLRATVASLDAERQRQRRAASRPRKRAPTSPLRVAAERLFADLGQRFLRLGSCPIDDVLEAIYCEQDALDVQYAEERGKIVVRDHLGSREQSYSVESARAVVHRAWRKARST